MSRFLFRCRWIVFNFLINENLFINILCLLCVSSWWLWLAWTSVYIAGMWSGDARICLTWIHHACFKLLHAVLIIVLWDHTDSFWLIWCPQVYFLFSEWWSYIFSLFTPLNHVAIHDNQGEIHAHRFWSQSLLLSHAIRGMCFPKQSFIST
jgi:hypothetical protein